MLSPSSPRQSWSRILIRWHQDEKLYKEIYARTVATLLAAFIGYLVLVVAGVGDPTPLHLILLIIAVAAFVISLWALMRAVTAPRADVNPRTGNPHSAFGRVFTPYFVMCALFVNFSAMTSMVFTAWYQGLPPSTYLLDERSWQAFTIIIVVFGSLYITINEIVRRSQKNN